MKHIERAILSAVSVLPTGHAAVVKVIDTVSAMYPPAEVRAAYWRLIHENRLVRSPDGYLTLPAR